MSERPPGIPARGSSDTPIPVLRDGRHRMTRRRIAVAYTVAAAGMAALGAATAVAIVALEERSTRRLGDGGPDVAPRAIQGHLPESGEPDVLDEASAFLGMCGSCDGGLPMACTCPTGDYRPVMLRLVREVEALRDEWRPVIDHRGTLASIVRCPDRCTCHGRYGDVT